MNNTPETPQRYICYKLFVFLYSLFVEPHVSEAFLVNVMRNDTIQKISRGEVKNHTCVAFRFLKTQPFVCVHLHKKRSFLLSILSFPKTQS